MNAIHLPVFPFQETLHADMCGPASLKIVLDFYGVVKTENEIAEKAGLVRGLGTNDLGLTKAAEAFGFRTEIKNEAGFDDISLWLDKGVPVIVDWFTRGRNDYPNSAVAEGHYSVVAGIDDTFIYLQDPEIGGLRKIARDDFVKVWFDFTGNTIKPDELIIRQLIAVFK